jgi:hypothetical protein
MISPPKRRNPAGGPGFERLHSSGQERQGKYNPNAAPASFWRGFAGTASMAPPIHRRPPKPRDSFWKPARAGGAA